MIIAVSLILTLSLFAFGWETTEMTGVKEKGSFSVGIAELDGKVAISGAYGLGKGDIRGALGIATGNGTGIELYATFNQQVFKIMFGKENQHEWIFTEGPMAAFSIGEASGVFLGWNIGDEFTFKKYPVTLYSDVAIGFSFVSGNGFAIPVFCSSFGAIWNF